MDLLRRTKELCRTYNIKPARSRGQNFLITEEIYTNIIEIADIKKIDTVLEVGPGLGFLTEKLAKKANKVTAVELDDKLAEILKIKFRNQELNNIKIINKNVLDYIHEFESSNFKIVANLPYNITSVFLRKVFSLDNKPELMVLMLQKEVAERIIAKPGKMSLLAVSVQFYAKGEIIRYVNREDFWPSPEVDSAIVQLRITNYELRFKDINEKDFFRLVKFGFSSKRKMLKNNLAGGFKIDQKEAVELIKKTGFNEKIRAQELSVEDWVKLFGIFKQFML